MAGLTDEELKKLSPEERIKVLRQLAQDRKKDLEDTRKQVEEELAAAEDMIQRSEVEMEDEEAIEDAKERLRDLRFTEEDLEQRVAAEKAGQSNSSEESPSYESRPANLYHALPEAVETLSRLYGVAAWSEEDRQHYQRSKEVVEKAQSYMLTSERLAEELGTGASILNRFKYRS
jgi:predicted phage gp36 major capsid-like protein